MVGAGRGPVHPPPCNRPRLHPRRSGGGNGFKTMYNYIYVRTYIHTQCAYVHILTMTTVCNVYVNHGIR